MALLLTIVSASAVLFGRSTTTAYRAGTTSSELDRAASRALLDVTERLRAASFGSISPTGIEAPASVSTIDFQRGIRIDGESVVWSDPERITLALSPAELDDGVDNDGNGLVDEREVVWTSNPGLAGEQRVVLCRGVAAAAEREILGNGIDDNQNGLIDEEGLAFDFGVGWVNVRLTLAARGPDGETILRTVEATVAFRNVGS